MLGDASCVFCLVLEEFVDHVLIPCLTIWYIWARFIKWQGISWCFSGNLPNMFQQ
jgi:hypothetical protein